MTSTDGRSEGTGVSSRVWYGGRRMRLEAGDAAGPAFVLQLDRGKAYRLDPVERTATEIDLERLRSSAQMDLSVAGDLMGGDEEGGPRTAALRTPKTIAGYRCAGYRIKAGSATMDLYVSQEVLSVSMPSPSSWTGPAPASRCGGSWTRSGSCRASRWRPAPRCPSWERSTKPAPPSPGSRWAAAFVPLRSAEGLQGPPRGTPSGAGVIRRCAF